MLPERLRTISAARAPIRRSPSRVADRRFASSPQSAPTLSAIEFVKAWRRRASRWTACGRRPGSTDRCVIYVDRHGENTIVSIIDAARGFDPIAETGLERWIAPGDWVVLQGNLQPGVTSACLALGREKGATTALNPSPTYAAVDYDWRLVDLVVVNRNEAIELGGCDNPIEAARALREAGAAAVVLTLGAEGAALITADETLRVSAPRVTAVDTVGAGDVFCGTLIAVRAARFDWEAALQAASEAAAICVTRGGVLASFPTRSEMAGILARGFVAEQRA